MVPMDDADAEQVGDSPPLTDPLKRFLEMAERLNDIDSRRIDLDTVTTSRGEFDVSTVDLVDPVPYNGQYETLISAPDGHTRIVRYRTRDDAVLGHMQIVEALTGGQFDVLD
jgi:hypothetical protein